MKHRLLTVVLLISLTALFGQVTFQAGLGIDFPGTQSWGGDLDDDVDTNLGFSPSFEVLWPVMPTFLLGGGLEYQIPRGLDEDTDGDPAYNFLPIFVSGKYGIPMDAAVHPEILLHLGYNIFMANDDYKGDADLTNGFYWGIGAGIVHTSGFTADLMYRRSMGGWEIDFYGETWEADIDQSQVTFRLGYRFGME